jgi:Icc-related predicted phosphoesterase
MLSILHVSDTHGDFPKLGPADVIVHSGDLLPNFSRGRPGEARKQCDWLEANANRFARWIGNRAFLYCAGNHDFLPPAHMADILAMAGVRIENITDNVVSVDGVAFCGFPWCPPITGEWKYETTEQDISDRLHDERRAFDVFVSHCPPAGILDLGHHIDSIGSTALAAWANGSGRPNIWLFGHAHESSGIAIHAGCLYSNAALTQHRIFV